MFTVKDWRETRPSSAKDTGMAAALQAWEDHCKKDPKGFNSYEEFAAAIKTCNELREAMFNAEKQLTSDGSAEAERTRALIKSNKQEVFLLKKQCLDLLASGRAEAEALVQRADAAADAALVQVDAIVRQSEKQVAAVEALKKELGDDPMAVLPRATIDDARKRLDRWQKQLPELPKMAREIATAVKNDKDVSHWRLQGAKKLIRQYMLPPAEADAYMPRFQQFTDKLNRLDGAVRGLDLYRDRQSVILAKMAATTDDMLDNVAAAVASFKKLAEALESRATALKDVTSKKPSVGNYGGEKKDVERLYKAQGYAGIKTQRHGAQAQIDQISKKLARLSEFRADLDKLVLPVIKSTPRAELEHKDVAPLVNKILTRRKELLDDASAWITDGEQIATRVGTYLKLLKDPQFKEAKKK